MIPVEEICATRSGRDHRSRLQVVGGYLELQSVRITKIDRMRHFVILEFKRDAAGPQLGLSDLKIGIGRRAESKMRHRVLSRFAITAAARKKRNEGRAEAQKNRHA